jgi:2'-5' RNA ligase
MIVRSFIAVEIPAYIQVALAKSIIQLQRAFPQKTIRWVNGQNVHLTLKFLGNIPLTSLECLFNTLNAELVGYPSFEITVGTLGAFPATHRARIIWIGLDAPEALMDLYRSIERVSARLGFPPDHRPFSPHLTIGRVHQNISGLDLQRIHSVLEGSTVGTLGSFIVDAVQIIKSDLQPGGPVYTHLFTIPIRTI